MSFVKKVLLIFFILSVFTSPPKAETIKLFTAVQKGSPAFKLCRELLDAIGTRMNAEITLSSLPQRRSNYYLKKGTLFHGDFARSITIGGLFSGLITIKEPIGKVRYYILTNKNIKYRTVKDLRKYSVAYRTGNYLAGDFLRKRARKTHTLESTEKCLRFMLAGRADIVIEENVTLGNMLLSKPFAGRVRRLEPPVFHDNVHTYFFKKYAKTAKRYELALISIKKDGTYMRIMSPYRKSAVEYRK